MTRVGSVPTSDHPSSSAAQLKAEGVIVAAVADQLGLDLRCERLVTSIPISKNAHVEVDAATPDRSTVVEAYARQGKLRGAQLKKVAQDVLKLSLVKTERAPADTRAVIAFASEEACQSITGWVREAANRLGIEFVVVAVPLDVRDEILRAQNRQVMVNIDQVADDVAIEDSEN